MEEAPLVVAERCRRLLARRPDTPYVRACLGNALLETGQGADGLQELRRAFHGDPNDPRILLMRGAALFTQGHSRSCIRVLNRLLEREPENTLARTMRGEAYLALGDFRHGLRDAESRITFAFEDRQARLAIAPLWEGEYLGPEKTLLVWFDFRLGDTIQFARFLPLVKARSGARIVLECSPPLVRLLKEDGLADVVCAPAEDDAPTSAATMADFQCPLSSLPCRLGIETPEDLPAAPYLRADPEIVDQWAAGLEKEEACLRVGLAWTAGCGANQHTGYVRSTELGMWDKVLAVPGVAFYSLQHGLHPTDTRVRTLPPFADFADTAALLSQLDLVMSVDTSVAHLSGALGKETWVLLPHNADWRWMKRTETSPWYPTARLFRQSGTSGWAEVLDRVAERLKVHCR